MSKGNIAGIMVHSVARLLQTSNPVFIIFVFLWKISSANKILSHAPHWFLHSFYF